MREEQTTPRSDMRMGDKEEGTLMQSTRTKFQTIDEYIQTFPENVQILLQQIRETIRATVPGGEETVSYQIPVYKLNGKYLVYFADYKDHVAMYPFSSAMEKSVKGASAYETSGKGTSDFR